jgi:tRNA-dihydrouridine synthase B
VNGNQPTLILSPLQGFTDVTFRNVFPDHFKGFDEAVAPFISTMGQQRLKPSRIKDVFPEKNKKLPVTPQILGNVAIDFIFLANHLYDLGYEKINWNLGCPHSKIAKKERGSGLLMYPKKIDEFLKKALPSLLGTLSVKIRLGRTVKEEIFDLLPVFDKYPLDEIILHPRTGTQMYQGSSDHNFFGQALSKSRHQFVYNGDITDLQSFNLVRGKFKSVDRFMIGRGVLSNPFIGEEIKGITDNRNRQNRLKEYHDHLLEEYQRIFSGPIHLTDRMKGFWSFIGPSFNDSKKYLKKILKAQSKGKYTAMVDDFFQQNLTFKP